MTGRSRVIAEYIDSYEADICKAKLEDAGIPCYLQKEAYQTLIPGQLPWPIKLHVPEQHAIVACQILEVPAEHKTSSTSQTKRPKCPRCQSEDIIDRGYLRLLAILISLGILYVFPLKFKYCKNCRHRW